MAAGNFATCLPIILGYEGGFSDDPEDPGGATMLGVTLGVYEQWVGRTVTPAELKALTPSDVAPIYRADYWDAVHGDDLPAGVDLMCFDEAVNQGPGRAVRTLQEAVGVTVDGSIGKITLAAVASFHAPGIIDAIRAARLAAYKSLPTYPRFGAGWTNRLNDVTARALSMAGSNA